MLSGTHLLDSLYSAMKDSPVIFKKSAKNKMIAEIIHSLDTVSFRSKTRYKNLFKENIPNNAYFLDFIRYDAQKDEMKKELIEKFHGTIRNYIEYLKANNGRKD